MKIFGNIKNLLASNYSQANISGFTLIELMIAMAILALLGMVALPAYQDYQAKVDLAVAEADIKTMSLLIKDYEMSNGSYPDSLATVSADSKVDPWGNPYQYINHEDATPGKKRKDKNLVPINSDYDLYSMGEDGKSVAPLTAAHSRDDIVRANNGRYVGIAEEY